MIRRPPRSTLDRSSAASDVYKRQVTTCNYEEVFVAHWGKVTKLYCGFKAKDFGPKIVLVSESFNISKLTNFMVRNKFIMGKFIYEVIFITVLLTFPINVFCQSPNILWQNSIGGLTEDNLSLFLETEDSGYVLAGSSTSMISGDKTVANNLYNDYWIVRVDSLSIIEWQNAIGGNGNDILMSIIATSDGGYFLGGYSDSGISGDKTEVNLGDDDFWVLKLDSVAVSYTHLRAHETVLDLVCRLLLEKKKYTHNYCNNL